MSVEEVRNIVPEMDEDGRGFSLEWSKGGFASVLRCRFGFVLYLVPESYCITFEPYVGGTGRVTWHQDRAGFAAVVVPELEGREPGLAPPLVMLMEVRFGQRLEGLPEVLSLVISKE